MISNSYCLATFTNSHTYLGVELSLPDHQQFLYLYSLSVRFPDLQQCYTERSIITSLKSPRSGLAQFLVNFGMTHRKLNHLKPIRCSVSVEKSYIHGFMSLKQPFLVMIELLGYFPKENIAKFMNFYTTFKLKWKKSGVGLISQ